MTPTEKVSVILEHKSIPCELPYNAETRFCRSLFPNEQPDVTKGLIRALIVTGYLKPEAKEATRTDKPMFEDIAVFHQEVKEAVFCNLEDPVIAVGIGWGLGLQPLYSLGGGQIRKAKANGEPIPEGIKNHGEFEILVEIGELMSLVGKRVVQHVEQGGPFLQMLNEIKGLQVLYSDKGVRFPHEENVLELVTEIEAYLKGVGYER